MKIGNLADKPAVVPTHTAPAVAPDAVKDAAMPARPDASVTVELSSAASNLMAGGSSAEFDADKVARIEQAIADGSFQIRPDAIADKLIANARELLGKVQR